MQLNELGRRGDNIKAQASKQQQGGFEPGLSTERRPFYRWAKWLVIKRNIRELNRTFDAAGDEVETVLVLATDVPRMEQTFLVYRLPSLLFHVHVPHEHMAPRHTDLRTNSHKYIIWATNSFIFIFVCMSCVLTLFVRKGKVHSQQSRYSFATESVLIRNRVGTHSQQSRYSFATESVLIRNRVGTHLQLTRPRQIG